MTRNLLAVPLLVALAVPGHHAQAPSPATSETACSHGVCLTFTLLRRSYPRNAVVPATASVRNGNPGVIWIEARSLVEQPVVRVLAEQSRVVYPPPFPVPSFDAAWKNPPPPQLRPGSVIRKVENVVLWGGSVQAVLHFRVQGTRAAGFTVRTPVIHLSLHSAPAPTIALTTSPVVSVTVRPPSGMKHGSHLSYVDWYTCPLASGGASYGGSGFYEDFSPSPDFPDLLIGYPYGWTRTRQAHIIPGCARPLEWHMVAGWLNQPVAVLSYVRHAS